MRVHLQNDWLISMFVANLSRAFGIADNYQGQCSLRLNHGKLLLVLQHQMMARRVRQRMGSQSGHVLAALLRQFEIRVPAEGDSQRPPSSERLDTNARYEQIDMDRLLDDVNAHDNTRAGEFQSEHNGQANGYVNSKLNHPDEIDMEGLEDHVAAIAEGSCDFILRDEDSGGWKIDVHDAEDRLRDDEIMQMVKRRFGLMSLRIIRILESRGKVDEKALQEIGLLNAKDLRRCLAQLNAHGFVDLQEVPREPQRQPARTIYLWFYDAERVRKRVLENLYKSMCRLLQRLKVERQDVSSTLQKAERSDVKGKEHEMLRSDEIAVLKRWRRKELWYLSELERLGCSVDVLQVA
jgi:DNA-directed RNA polymerase III subunit RPC3